MRKQSIFSKLFWQISIIFLLVLIVFGSLSLFISIRAARNYSIEVNQKLNRDLAQNMVDVIKPDFRNGIVNESAVQDIVHSMMVINPSVEVYLLDPKGKILAYVAPDKVVKLKQVSLAPINRFLSDQENNIIYGEDPRNPGEQKIFSVAPVIENEKLTGYIYIVLASQEYTSASQMVLGSYILGLSMKSIISILVLSALIGLFLLWIITQKLNVIIYGIRQFRSGNLKARIPAKNSDDLDKISLAFNEMASTIEKNIEELNGLDNLRKELISNVSHDLRTPIASIQGYAETLLIKKDDISREDQARYLEIIYNSCEKLKKLVADLFELSKLQTNQIKLNKEPFSLAELVHDIANKYRLLSQKQGISINTIVSDKIPVVIADISLIDRVVQNLIDNALKFCKSGDYINISMEPNSSRDIKFTIADSGKGISNEILPHIFERYYKGSESKSSSGLGLAIVKKIIDLHGSTIHVESIYGKGTKFYFFLPIANVG